MVTQEEVITFITKNSLTQAIGEDIITEINFNFKKGKKDLILWVENQLHIDSSNEKLKALQTLLHS